MNATSTIAISGATGMIGAALVVHLRARGYTVRRLVRSGGDLQQGDIQWDPRRGTLDTRNLDGCGAIINLAGEPIAERWTDAHMREIRESRVAATSLIARAVGEMAIKPRVVLSGSAIGFYGNGGDAVIDEKSVSRGGFLASVVRDWEEAASPMLSAGVRVVFVRSGMVLSGSGGALKKLLPPFKLGLGGPMGGGSQWMSWIALRDHVRATEHALDSESLRGAVNFVSPNAVRNSEFARALGDVVNRPAVIPLPGVALKLMFGQMAEETILWGQHVVPTRLQEAGFVFQLPELRGALEAALEE